MAPEPSSNPNPLPPEDTLPPVLSPPPAATPASAGRNALVWLLGITLGLFFLDATISLVDDTVILCTGLHLLTLPRALVFLLTGFATSAVYILMAFLPMIPKRVFLPVTLFNPVSTLAAIPLLIYFYDRLQVVIWATSLVQWLAALWLLRLAKGSGGQKWTLFPADHLLPRGFRWGHLLGFAAVNLFALLPLLLVYSGVCLAFAVNYATAGFVRLRPSGITMQSRDYARADGKVIRLVPMTHIGDAAFYQLLTSSFPTNATILMEGVTDKHKLLTNTLSYKSTAKKFGLTEQHEEFRPPEVSLVRADVDVSDFGTNTLAFLNLIIRFNSTGGDADTLRQLLLFQPPPGFERDLFNDILHKRNEHLLSVIKQELSSSELLVVPWGAAHMPEISRALEKDGFHATAIEDRTAISFQSSRSAPTPKAVVPSEK
ncbi:MAG: hypothetical protein RLY20_2163 [Verrucomicrobiota bacterium]|jgi:hypothetical protein